MTLSINNLDNAAIDCNHIAEIATSTAATATDRMGNIKDTVKGAVAKLAGFTSRGLWVTATIYALKDLVSNSGTWYACVVPHTSSAAFATDSASKWRVYQGLTTGDANTGYLTPSNIFAPATGGTDTRGVELSFNAPKGAFRYGGSDPLPTNDERGFWDNLINKNAWGHTSNIGLYSTAFNRNGASVGTYSNTFGHDCISFGTASIAGGAGSATGNPADPYNAGYLFNGYCSFAYGKNVRAGGEKSVALCEESVTRGRADIAAGYFCNTGLNGIGKVALGHRATAGMATGKNGTYAMGSNVKAENGQFLYGRGINDATPLESTEEDFIGFGANVARPTVGARKGDGTAFDRGEAVVRGKGVEYRSQDPTFPPTAYTSQDITNNGSGGYGEWKIKVLRAGAMTPAFSFDGGGTLGGPVSLLPASDGVERIGGSGRSVAYIYLTNAPIVTSDQRVKQDIKVIDDAVLDAWQTVHFAQYRLIADVTENDGAAKVQFGVIAQEVVAAFAAQGLDAHAYGLISFDKWEANDDRPAGERYGVLYEQALVLECAVMRREMARLKTKLA